MGAVEGYVDAVSHQMNAVSLNSAVCVARLGDMRRKAGLLRVKTPTSSPSNAGFQAESPPPLRLDPQTSSLIHHAMDREAMRQQEVTQEILTLLSRLRPDGDSPARL